VAYARWDPLRDLLALQERIERLSAAGEPGWSPPVDLYEAPDRLVLTAEVPGLAQDDIQIQFHDGYLLLQGGRRPPEVPCEQYHRVERGHGRFARRFALRTAIAVDEITAELRDGILTVIVPKADAGRPRTIDVS